MTSSSMPIEKHFASIVFHEQVIPWEVEVPSHMIPIRLMLVELIGSKYISAPLDDTQYLHQIRVTTDIYFVVSRSHFVLPSKRDFYTKILAEYLSDKLSSVPEVEQPTVIHQIFRAVELADIPGVPVTGILIDATIRLYDDDETIVEWIAPDSLQRFLPGLMPATKSSIEGLEKVRLENLEATVRLTQCVICKEGLDHFDDDVEEGLVTRLPCSHLYHGDCIVQWLETSNLCPLCRYPMPVMEEEEEPSKPSGARLSWPVLLTVSAGGIIAAVLLCRLLKRS